MKKLFAVLTAIALVLTMGTTFAFAANTGSITINNAVNRSVYEVYKMLDFEPGTQANSGIYTIADGWADFFTTGKGADYFTVTPQGDKNVVTLKDGVDDVDQTLAKAAIAYADEKGIAATATETASGTSVAFTGLPLGYYAIDTSLGTLCALTNTDSDEDIWEKNGQPDIDKFVQEDSLATGANAGWQKVNDADIGQVVKYKSTITVGEGVTKYVMHDKMEAGLTFNNDVEVKLADGTVVDASNYTVKTTGLADDCTFEVVFEDDFILGLAKNSTFTVYYSATLNEDAVIGNVDNGNENEVYLSYGEDTRWETNVHKTSTFTWEIDISKVDGTDKTTPLAGAEFQLVIKKTDAQGNEVESFVKFAATAEANVYKVVATDAAEDDAATVITTDATGKFNIEGLDEGTYYLRETKAPEGYNLLADDITVTIASTYNENDRTADYTVTAAGANGTTITVENNSGSLLPETGGIGTTIFTVVGVLLMAVAVVFLVSKKRMATFA